MKDKWISVEDKEPNDEQEYLLLFETGYIRCDIGANIKFYNNKSYNNGFPVHEAGRVMYYRYAVHRPKDFICKRIFHGKLRTEKEIEEMKKMGFEEIPF
jgi:hypothetical protein